MNDDEKHIPKRSAATSRNGKKSSGVVSDEAFLRQETVDAKRAVSDAATAVRLALIAAVSPRAWARSHPLLSVAAAATVGFMTAKRVRSETPKKTASSSRKSSGDSSWKQTLVGLLKTTAVESLALYGQAKVATMAAREAAAQAREEASFDSSLQSHSTVASEHGSL
jgi:hypothetical protein